MYNCSHNGRNFKTGNQARKTENLVPVKASSRVGKKLPGLKTPMGPNRGRKG